MRSAYDEVSRRGAGLGSILREHPVALTLIGVGLAWLALTARSGERAVWSSGIPGRLGHRVQRLGEDVRDAASNAYDRANDTVRSAAEHLRDQVSGSGVGNIDPAGMVRAGSDRVARTASGVTHFVEDNPLIGGAIGLAAGIAIGAALPSTRTEDRWLGEASDEAYGRLKTTAEGAIDRGLQAAGSAINEQRS
jgi:hypothetical protein